MISSSPSSARCVPAVQRPFQFDQDTFAYVNELIWEYHFDSRSRALTTQWRKPSPAYAHYCFVVVRSARQFFHNARFAPENPRVGAAELRQLAHRVLSRNPRRIFPSEPPIIIPGYGGLRAFSQAHEALLKEACGGAWQSYFLRSHWRMVFPFSRAHQARMAEQLLNGVRQHRLPIVHLVRFPQLTINHGMLLFGVEVTEQEWRFQAYDPNEAGQPECLRYDPACRTFDLAQNRYYAGGRVDVYEIFTRWPY